MAPPGPNVKLQLEEKWIRDIRVTVRHFAPLCERIYFRKHAQRLTAHESDVAQKIKRC